MCAVKKSKSEKNVDIFLEKAEIHPDLTCTPELDGIHRSPEVMLVEQ